MTLVVQDGFANLFLGYTLTGDPQTMYTAIGIDFDGDPTVGEGITIIEELVAGWHINMKGVTPEPYTLGPSHADMGVTDGPNGRVDVALTTPGEGASTAMPSNCSYLVTKSTTLGGRQGRGRMYIPGVSGGGIDANGVINVGVLDAIQDAVVAFGSFAVTVTGVDTLCLFHSGESPDPSTIVGLTVSNQIATQRRRMRP